MPSNSQPDNLFLSFLITAVILVQLGIVYALIKYRNQIKMRAMGVETILAKPIGLTLFTIARIGVGLAGIGVFIATFAPDLTPFGAYANQNLDLGGIIYIFIWPLLILQAIAGFIPYSKKWISAQPLAAWAILLSIGYIAINFDLFALSGMYDVGLIG